jgi:hypothetical protein
VDAVDDGRADLSDAVTILAFLLLGGAPVPEPGPASCGLDPTLDQIDPCAAPCG